MIRLTDSVCSLSWINKKTGLPEHDGEGPPSTFAGNNVTREDDALPFRFVNLLEADILVSGSPPRIVDGNFTSDSKIYQNPSFGQIKSEAFEIKRSTRRYADRLVFLQTVGARTVSPEKIAYAVGAGAGIGILPVTPFAGPIGGTIGRKIAHELFGFPPIWTTLQLTLFADGRSEGSILCYSLFPSMNFYIHDGGTAGNPRITSLYKLVGSSYDAVTHLDEWKTHGWGPLPAATSGPCQGNPWRFRREDLTVREVESEQRIV